MPCQYEVLVIDLDGTLLARDGSVSEGNCRAVGRARDAGVEVIIATGRALSESAQALRAVGHEGMVVAAGGSLLCDAATGATIDRRVLSHDVVVEVTNSLLDHGHKVLILKDAHAAGYDYLAVGNDDFDPASQWWFSHLPVQVRHAETLIEDVHPLDTVRAAAVACESRLAPLASQLKEVLGQRCFLQHWPAVTESQCIGLTTHLLEVFTPDVNKWTMIRDYCRNREIDPGRVAAIGDGLNDVELVGNAGMGIAMGNSIPAVLAAGKYVTGHHDDDGVATAIERILSGEWN